jgi:hypothetical protein
MEKLNPQLEGSVQLWEFSSSLKNVDVLSSMTDKVAVELC